MCESRGRVLGSPTKDGRGGPTLGYEGQWTKSSEQTWLIKQSALGRSPGGHRSGGWGFTWAMRLLCSPPVPPISHGAGSGRLPQARALPAGHAQWACAVAARRWAGLRLRIPTRGSAHAQLHESSAPRVRSCSDHLELTARGLWRWCGERVRKAPGTAQPLTCLSGF